jgi:hypothetical protein
MHTHLYVHMCANYTPIITSAGLSTRQECSLSKILEVIIGVSLSAGVPLTTQRTMFGKFPKKKCEHQNLNHVANVSLNRPITIGLRANSLLICVELP